MLVVFELQLVFSAVNKLSAFRTTYFVQSFLTVTMGVVFLILLCYMGSLVNEELLLHS